MQTYVPFSCLHGPRGLGLLKSACGAHTNWLFEVGRSAGSRRGCWNGPEEADSLFSPRLNGLFFEREKGASPVCPNLLWMLTWEGGRLCRASLHVEEVTCTYLSAMNSLGNLSCVSGSLEVTMISWVTVSR